MAHGAEVQVIQSGVIKESDSHKTVLSRHHENTLSITWNKWRSR